MSLEFGEPVVESFARDGGLSLPSFVELSCEMSDGKRDRRTGSWISSERWDGSWVGRHRRNGSWMGRGRRDGSWMGRDGMLSGDVGEPFLELGEPVVETFACDGGLSRPSFVELSCVVSDGKRGRRTGSWMSRD